MMLRFSKDKGMLDSAFQDLRGDLKRDTNDYLTLLAEACERKDANMLEDILHDGFLYKRYDKNFVTPLCNLLLEDWHFCHENIASILQKLQSSDSIEYLYKAAQLQFDYLRFDEVFAFATKCIWALGDINTPKAREKLELLTLSENEIIKREANYQLARH